jgi:AmmeMemoRadiSam system protein A
MTSEADRQALLRVARAAIAARVRNAGPPRQADTGALHERRGGAFVTIHKNGQLRGCIGHIEPDDPIVETVAQCAIAASTTDPRFPPLTVAELEQIDLELSLLGPLEPISGPADIEVGRHGLVVERGWNRGLLLPQVATEWGWDAETFLSQTCQKARLPPDAWKQGAKLWRFEAEVFGER